jgi:hypothetical protein
MAKTINGVRIREKSKRGKPRSGERGKRPPQTKDDEEEQMNAEEQQEEREEEVQQAAAISGGGEAGAKKKRNKRRKKKNEQSSEATASAEGQTDGTVDVSESKDVNEYLKRIKAIDRRIAATGLKVANKITEIYEKGKAMLPSLGADGNSPKATENKATDFMGLEILTNEFNERKFGDDKGKKPPSNIKETELNEKQRFIFEGNEAYNTSDTLRVDLLGERPIFAFSDPAKIHRQIVDIKGNGTRLFKADESIMDSLRYASVIFPHETALQVLKDYGTTSIEPFPNKSGTAVYSFIKQLHDYLGPMGDKKQDIIKEICKMTYYDSKIRWRDSHKAREYRTSEYITYLSRTTGVSVDVTNGSSYATHRIEIHRKMVSTRLKDETTTKGLMVICEEMIIQLQKKFTDLKEQSEYYTNTDTCLILSARIDTEQPRAPMDGKGKKPEPSNHIHFQGMGSFSIDFVDNPVQYDGILSRKIDIILSTAWLIEQMSYTTNSNSQKNEIALKLFERIIRKSSVQKAAKKIREKRYKARDQIIPAPETIPDIEILQNSFISFQRAHMILPKRRVLKPQNNVSQRATVSELFTAPSFSLIVLTITGGKSPLNYLFLKTYGIHGSEKSKQLVEEDKRRAMQERIQVMYADEAPVEPAKSKQETSASVPVRRRTQRVSSSESSPSKQTHFTHDDHLLFDDELLLASCSTLPEELELELELL